MPKAKPEPTPEGNQSVTFDAPIAHVAFVDKEAEVEDLTRSDILRRALREYVVRRSQKS